MICAETFAKLDNYVWQRAYRWARHRHANKTGQGVAQRYFPHKRGEAWRFTDPVTGKTLIRVQEVVKQRRHIKVKANANPFDSAWEAYFQHRDRQVLRHTTTAFRAKVLQRQNGIYPVCRQVIQFDEVLELHHKDGNHQYNRLTTLVLLHPNCHRQEHYAPDRQTKLSHSSLDVGHA